MYLAMAILENKHKKKHLQITFEDAFFLHSTRDSH
jgi:hypothetical protein